MSLNHLLATCLTLLTLPLVPTNGQDVDLTGIKCIVRGSKAAKESFSSDYKGGKVYFCCNGCKQAFEKDQKKEKSETSVLANHQLVLTGQYVQKGCPFSGSPTSDEQTAKVGGVDVAFCCEHCKGKVEAKESLADKAALVFSDKAFKTGFRSNIQVVDISKVKCMMMKDRPVSKDHFVEYKEGKVYFCCGRCAKKFADDPKAFATQANQQLVVSGQYVQTGCPISGGDVDEDQTSKVAGIQIGFCCPRCKGKVDSAADEASKAKIVFSEKRFEKAYSKK